MLFSSRTCISALLGAASRSQPTLKVNNGVGPLFPTLGSGEESLLLPVPDHHDQRHGHRARIPPSPRQTTPATRNRALPNPFLQDSAQGLALPSDDSQHRPRYPPHPIQSPKGHSRPQRETNSLFGSDMFLFASDHIRRHQFQYSLRHVSQL